MGYLPSSLLDITVGIIALLLRVTDLADNLCRKASSSELPKRT